MCDMVTPTEYANIQGLTVSNTISA